MQLLFGFYILCLGVIIGSFLNVVILRINTGRSMGGRSQCATCGKMLSWVELIPVLSYLMLIGKCRKCRSSISSQYIMVELFTGILFVLLALKETHLFTIFSIQVIATLILGWIMVSLLVVIFFYDLRHMIIPDRLSFALVCVGVLYVLAGLLFFNTGYDNVLSHLYSGIVLGGFLGLLWLISSGRWIGFGDVKLVFGLGIFLPLYSGLAAMVLAFWVGAVVGLIKIGLSRLSSSPRRIIMKSEIPFAPFLILGFLSTFLLEIDIFQISALFS